METSAGFTRRRRPQQDVVFPLKVKHQLILLTITRHVFILRIGSEVFWTINARESRMNLWSQGRPKGATYFYGGGPTAAICGNPL